MGGPTFVLVHSPLVGPATWRPMAEVLARRGHVVRLPALPSVFDGEPPYHPRLAETIAANVQETDDPVVLVAHSGAGALVPATIARLDVAIDAVVFVDALLPHGGGSGFDDIPAELAAQLRSMHVDGLLPPWHTWFPPEELTELLPTPALRNAVVADVPRVPIAYFEEPAPLVPDWQPERCGYLQLSEGYAVTAEDAAGLGWRVDRYPSDHLAMVTRPTEIAGRLLALAAR